MSKRKIIRKVGQKYSKGQEVNLKDSQVLEYHSLGWILLSKQEYVSLQKNFRKGRDIQTSEDRQVDRVEKSLKNKTKVESSLKSELEKEFNGKFVTKEVLDASLENLFKRLQPKPQPQSQEKTKE